jgi:hypothetical protein
VAVQPVAADGRNSAETTYSPEPQSVELEHCWKLTLPVGLELPQIPLEHVRPDPHATALPHCPHALQVCTELPEHWVAFGVHTGVAAQVQVPHVQLAEQVCVP